MHKLRVGVPVDFGNYDIHTGGAFSYATQLIAGIDKHIFSDEIELIFLDYTGKAKTETRKEIISFHPFAKSSVSDFCRKGIIEILKKLGTNFFQKIYNGLESIHTKKRSANSRKILIKNNIHILLYVKPDGIDVDYPFLAVHWDIGHCSTYMFPEFAESFESRAIYYHKTLNRALYILTETQAERDELINFTNINADRIGVMPIFPGIVIKENVSAETQNDILTKFGITNNQFFLYPAQFWPHKNHTLLIDAMKEISRLHPNIKLILTGSDKGNLAYIKNCIKEEKLNDHIKILGFVNNAELFTLYKNAIALVMPTFLGPSNMPPLEAASLNCAVIISDLAGHRELMKNYATYFDPTNVNDLIDKMLKSITNEKNNQPFDSCDFNIDGAMMALEASLLKIKPIRHTWGH